MMKVYKILPVSRSLSKASPSVFMLAVNFWIGVREIPPPQLCFMLQEIGIYIYTQTCIYTVARILHVRNHAMEV